MKADIRNGRRVKGLSKDVRSWVETLNVKATSEGDQYILAAVARALFYEGADELRKAIIKEANKCANDHRRRNNVADEQSATSEAK